MNLKVKQIFYSLQGEGARQGEASIFVRLSGCNLQCEFCDTDYTGGEEMSLFHIHAAIRDFACKWIVWTGGEPSLQLTDDVLIFFKKRGYLQAIESNGHKPLSDLLDYTVVSPKFLNMSYARTMNPRVDEVRLPIKHGQEIPSISILPEASHYCLSPIFVVERRRTRANIQYCVKYIEEHPEWRLSVQMHKLIGLE
jgi:organic radical activating enzyme